MEEVIECMSLENRQQFEAILRSRRKEKISLNLDPKEYARLQKPSNVSWRNKKNKLKYVVEINSIPKNQSFDFRKLCG